MDTSPAGHAGIEEALISLAAQQKTVRVKVEPILKLEGDGYCTVTNKLQELQMTGNSPNQLLRDFQDVDVNPNVAVDSDSCPSITLFHIIDIVFELTNIPSGTTIISNMLLVYVLFCCS